MKRIRVSYIGITAFFIALKLGHGDFIDTQINANKHHGFIAYENGQIMSGISGTSNLEIKKGWLDRLLLQFSNEYSPNSSVKLITAVEAQLGFSYPQSISDRSTYLSRFWLYPADVEGVYTLGDKEKPYLQCALGYFPYKYNKNVRNLGEFLFRSGTYPPYIVNSFNMPFSRLLGLRLSSTLFGELKQELLLASESQIFPTQDFSLSYLAHYTAAHCFEIGAGISFSRLFSIENRLTNPTQFPDPQDPLRFVVADKYSNMYITQNGDTAFYSFQGIKPVIWLGFDPKTLLSSEIRNVLGKNDGNLYAEACIIGWKNYKNYNTDTTKAFPDYHNRWDRTVASIGWNAPTFDVLSIELEYDPITYPNSYKNVIDRNLPEYLVLPGKNLSALKWSLYGKKTFLDRFCLVGQVALDHMRPAQPSYIQTERDDVLSRHGDWWWVLRLLVNY